MPEEEELPAPGDRYFEIETAKLHGGWPVWVRLTPQERAFLLAHELHKNLRDHYYFDKRSKMKPDDKPPVKMPHEQMRDRYFGGGKRL